MANAPRDSLQMAYRLMRRRFGHQNWWPGETPFEVCVGAILTQNTNWGNVERAIQNLKREQLMDPRKLFALPESQLAELIRPAGYFNVKSRRLRSFLRVLVEEFDGSLDRMFQGETPAVRRRLLEIKGIGPETADSMLLYAGGHTSFVIDAYTRRIFQRHEWCGPEASYGELQSVCMAALDEKPSAERLDYWQDYHAQLVRVGKEFCRAGKPRCEHCPLKPLLPQACPETRPNSPSQVAAAS
ncbi:MAG: endonuclease III domain-containing protein [Candidatus Omnitrophica bacterium]|nr:endonuclease III domain-containing protein [Candidatus Omnitrophota bacterium]